MKKIMENKNLYYTPKIEDIRVGYQCEVNWSKGYSENFEPLKTILKDEEGSYCINLDDAIISYDDGYAEFRTKYLTKEDIENCGWVNTGNISPYFGKDKEFLKTMPINRYFMDDFQIRYKLNLEQGKIRIEKQQFGGFSGTHESYEQIFYGKCLSINEFKYITKELLNIQ